MSHAPSNEDLLALAASLLDACRASGIKVATAESCTGGLIAGYLTEIPGSSDVVDRGFITYSDESKTEMLGVPKATIKDVGAVSEEVARKMAEGARDASRASIAVAVTGVAGPGRSENKPVGRVHMAAAGPGETRHLKCDFGDLTRHEIRLLTVEAALNLLLEGIPA